MQKKILQTIVFIIFSDSLMFYQIFLSPQVEQCAIITYKHGIYELNQELLNDLRPSKFDTAYSPMGGPLRLHKKKKT